jgi:hypothetical protein
MANGKKEQPWYPADDVEAEKAAQGEVYEGQDGQFYQHENMPKASPKNPPAVAPPPAPEPTLQTSAKAESPAPKPHPHATLPAVSESGPSAADLDAIAAENAAKLATSAPPSLVPAPSVTKPVHGGPTNPSYDADKYDSTGNTEKKDGIPGPRGVDRPADVMSDEERAAVATKQEDRLRKGMSPTHSVDSTGQTKGEFAVVPQGNDKHGARLPDKVDFSKPVEAHNPVAGPRGQGAPKDTFHKK